MNQRKKIAFISSMILMTLILIFFIFLFIKKERKDNKDNKKSKASIEKTVKVKDNVNIITSKSTKESQPIKVTKDTIIFKKNPKYKVGDVIVSGIIDTAPNGFIRKVINITKEKDFIKYKTKSAVLTEVFEEAHIIKTFSISNTEVKDMDKINNGVMSLNLASKKNDENLKTLIKNKNTTKDSKNNPAIKIKPSKNGIGVKAEINDKIGKNLEVNGEIEVNTYFEIKIDIENGEINFGTALHTDTNGDLFVGCKKELFDKDNNDKFNGEYEKELINTALPTIQFAIGPVPVVITNDFELSAEVESQLEGQIGTSIGIKAEKVSGFEYSSKTGDIVDINEKKYLSDGIEFKTEAKASGELEAGIYAHLITKLYGSTGTDISAGIAGNIKGELGLGINEKFKPTLFGSLGLNIGPKVSGKIIVTTPVIDYKLVDTEILKVSLPAFWEKKWEIPDPTLKVLQKGDFSYFAGTYIASSQSAIKDEDYYNGIYEELLDNLKLSKNGIISGGGWNDKPNPFSNKKPKRIEKTEDGAYKCIINEENSKKNIFYIYPIGYAEKRFNKEKVFVNSIYIRYESNNVNNGECIYFKEEKENLKNGWINYSIKDAFMPELEIRYPKTWNIKYTELGQYEKFIIYNNRGTEIKYYYLGENYGNRFGSGSWYIFSSHRTKVKEASFIPCMYNGKNYSSLGKFAIAKITLYECYNPMAGEEPNNEEQSNSYEYAVIPESYLNDISYRGDGCWSVFGFKYVRPIGLYATPAGGKFTNQEEKEVIQILDSFKVKEN